MTDPNLSHDLKNAKPSTSISGPVPAEKTSVDNMLATVEKYFMDCSYSCGKCYTDGYSVELVKEDLDATTLLSSLTRIVFDSVRQDPEISADRKVELSLMYQSIDNILQIIKHSKKNVAHNDILCKIIGYCMKNYQIYNNNNTHDRSRKI